MELWFYLYAGLRTSQSPPMLRISSGSSSIKLLPPRPPLLVLPPVPVRGGKAGFSKSSSIRFCTGFLVKLGGGAIDRLAVGCRCALDSSGGSSRYRCGGGAYDGPGEGLLERSEGFLLGTGGGAGFRRTCGLFED